MKNSRLQSKVLKLCQEAKMASARMALVDTSLKNKALLSMAAALGKNSKFILRENSKDIGLAIRKGLSSSMIDRLTLTKDRVAGMARSLAEIARLKDPVGEILETIQRPNGLSIKKIRVPIGTILIIYESRPNVTSDCVGLCLKSGNSVILRGGKEAIRSNRAIAGILKKQAKRSGLPAHAVSFVSDTDRAAIDELLKQIDIIDLVMPRGGESLIREVTKKSRIPVIKHFKGVCHTYVDYKADIAMARRICFNAKVQRPGVCNAMETLLVNKDIAGRFLPGMIKLLQDSGVEIRGCPKTRRIAPDVIRASESDWYAEYLDLILSVRVVKDVGEAIEHIAKYGSHHSDAIVTEDKKNADRFLREVDSACVYVNASTRFTDGGEFGKAAEIGISTDKIHARGPVGLQELTSYKYIVHGKGQTRR